jgi:glycosyltransferase involved in cell wall biosynthesis
MNALAWLAQPDISVADPCGRIVMTTRKSASNIVPFAKNVLLSIIVPVFNEQENIKEFHRRLDASLGAMEKSKAEIIYINDGSTDESMSLLFELMRRDRRVHVLDLSRNFGKEAAITAGLDQARGDVVIVIDSDLQDPPELIPEMVREWQNGYDVINMRRISRAGETWLKKITARAFYNLMARLGPSRMPANVGDFRLLSSRAVVALRQMPERTRIMKGLFAWIGFPVKEITYHRDGRHAGKTKWKYSRLWNLAIEGITSSSVAPLKAASYAGVLTALAAFAYGVFVVVKTIIHGDPVPGYPSLVVMILFLSGIQLLAIGVVGEYLARMFIETKQRPLYLIKRHYRTAKKHESIPLKQEERS